MTIPGTPVSTIAAGTTVELSGASAAITFAGVSPQTSLLNNAGTVRILNGRTFAMTNALNNTGSLELGGAALADATLSSGGNITNVAAATIVGHGTLTATILNSGTVRASGGTLVVSGGKIDGQSGTIQINADAALDLSAASGASDGDYLIHNGTNLNLGANNIEVALDYNNASFGVGNSFNPRANVTGSGQINADPSSAQGLSDTPAGGLTFLGADTYRLAFGNIHVGDSKALGYQIANVGGVGPSLRGAIQTTVNGGNLTDARLSGAGVTASNFGPLAATQETGDLAVTFDGTTAGALTGQQVRIINNFDNVNDLILQFTGAAYRYANPTAHTPEPVNFGYAHIGDVLTQALSITNNVPNDGFSERLDASIGSPTGSATTNSGSFADLAPGSTNNSSLVVGIDTSTAGIKSGTATISFVSDGTGSSGLGNTNLASQTVNIQAQVNNFAIADVVKLSGHGFFAMTGPDEFTLNLGSIVEGQAPLTATLGMMNDAAAPSDDLAGSFTLAAPDFGLTGFSSFSGVAAGATQGGFVVSLDDSNVGDFTGQITLLPRSTNPQPFTMDLDPITIHVFGAVRLGGDYNFDGAVNAADYTVWRNTLGQSVPIGTGADGSGPFGPPDGLITQHDFTYWKSRYGNTAPGAGTGASQDSDASAVPEPSTNILLFAGTIWLVSASRRRPDF
jgi:hypothetical protein